MARKRPSRSKAPRAARFCDDCVTLILNVGMTATGDLPPPHMADDDGGDLTNIWAQIRIRNVKTISPGHRPVHPLRAEGTDQYDTHAHPARSLATRRALKSRGGRYGWAQTCARREWVYPPTF
jgi:hypothetical protein